MTELEILQAKLVDIEREDDTAYLAWRTAQHIHEVAFSRLHMEREVTRRKIKRLTDNNTEGQT
jgi:hypothetical protein